MRGAMLSVVSAFAIMLQVAADIPIQPDLDVSKTMEKSIVRVVETDYSSYCIHHVETAGAVVNALHLYTRTPEATDEVKGKFTTLATSLGFAEDKIIYLTKSGKLDTFQGIGMQHCSSRDDLLCKFPTFFQTGLLPWVAWALLPFLNK
ncbi:hypothetical protein lerEdw1_015899 [Lerista edwardsae]|nr:hypothetical protein lerEdw1_015899 [Lerista edwardsae]